VYEFHPVVAKLQVYCSDDLGSFYLDILKDRLYTTAPKSKARRSAQTALHHISHSLLRLIAPFLSFTAEEAWQIIGNSESIFMETFLKQPTSYFDIVSRPITDDLLPSKWSRIREIRDLANKEIEALRAAGAVGSSLQTNLTIEVGTDDHALFSSLGPDLKFVFITSAIELKAAHSIKITATATQDEKCERCWHYSADVGSDAAHPTICGRCSSNLYGTGEVRKVA
jgi:isoleucyl-tRNA synthetase